ncbi:MAG: methionine biosynthesis protein MetW [Thermoflexales bacterium]|nr:methionine biosynthesis protein MetW [Thermoflexales bacterium]MCS7324221.1 methionine biosynthesis protein MetW [Thermoflexales bacterium]MCX7939281.1 methionine biosynthesis protein MetW [Thermoflexales bacterium]MDW8054745.1 methionine biosynthesis protein MetW [Anaerolineae bacterium]MDW8292546.1 methionine biosynthesis protein MetW [Anaerolineae bacterium]
MSRVRKPRYDFSAIVELVTPGARVLDLGCGDGELLAQLVAQKGVYARGVEISEAAVRACVARGLSVRQGNIEEGLADFPDGVFDFVILSETIAYLNRPAPVVQEMLRVGRTAIISFRNAGYWRVRWDMLRGKGFGAPLIAGEPRERAITLSAFEAFCQALGARVQQRVFLSDGHRVHIWPSLRARIAVYALTRE